MAETQYPQIEIRSTDDTLQDPPYYSGSEKDVQEWVACHPGWDVWFHVTNGDGTTETVSLEEFLGAQ